MNCYKDLTKASSFIRLANVQGRGDCPVDDSTICANTGMRYILFLYIYFFYILSIGG